MARTKQLYEDSGVELSKATISAGDEVTLKYSGLLARSGADEVYAHIGYGDDWKEKEFIPMQNDNGIFRTTIKVSAYDSLNIAFKDSGENWDNNSYENYSFKVARKSEKSETAKVARKSSAATEKSTVTEKKATAKVAQSKKETAEKKPAKTTATKKAATKKP
ncbi:MAG: carbohydrate-binding protein [Clostridiaceae bacterium]|nr:carbohydrate-binding protein [Clostridiaceae bacterium]